MSLIKVQLGDLNTFCAGSLFQHFSVKPVSPLRVESYIHNPRAEMQDVVLYLFVDENDQDIIAFRTILPDFIPGEKNIKFGWCSGVWVKPEYRGRKLSRLLLEEVLKDWDGRLMFTNYAPASEYCYLSTSRFAILKERNGIRFYFYPNLNRIYRNRDNYQKVKFILPLISFCIRKLTSVKYLFFKKKYIINNYTESEFPDETCIQYRTNFPSSFFGRNENEWNWIMQYPWITGANQDFFNYPFSYSNISYSLKTVKLSDGNAFAGFFIYSIIRSRMKILFHFVNKDKQQVMFDVIAHIANKNNIEYLTILDPEMASLFKKQISTYGFSKHFTSNIYSSLKLSNTGNKVIFDGDGDNCFT